MSKLLWPVVRRYGKYLGIPSDWGRSKREMFSWILSMQCLYSCSPFLSQSGDWMPGWWPVQPIVFLPPALKRLLIFYGRSGANEIMPLSDSKLQIRSKLWTMLLPSTGSSTVFNPQNLFCLGSIGVSNRDPCHDPSSSAPYQAAASAPSSFAWIGLPFLGGNPPK